MSDSSSVGRPAVPQETIEPVMTALTGFGSPPSLLGNTFKSGVAILDPTPIEEASVTDSVKSSTLVDSSSSVNVPPPEPEIRVWRPVASSSKLPELPDQFFEPSAGELHRALAGQAKTREALIDGPLLTKKTSRCQRDQSSSS